jgi:hypothetical protein
MALLIAPSPPADTAVQRFVRETFSELNDELQRLISTHKRYFALVWHSVDWTPEEFFAAAGNQGERFLMVGWANKENIKTFAQIQGLTLDDLLSPDDYTPPRQYTVSGGVVTILPVTL